MPFNSDGQLFLLQVRIETNTNIIEVEIVTSHPAGLTGDHHQLWTSHQFITSLSPVVHAILHAKKLVTTGSDVTSLSPVSHPLCQVGTLEEETTFFVSTLFMRGINIIENVLGCVWHIATHVGIWSALTMKEFFSVSIDICP